MFSVITNNKKTKGPTLMELFTATGKLIFFWQLEMFDVCTTGDTAHIDTIFKLLPQASTWVHRYSSLLQWPVPLVQRGHVTMVERILCTKCTLHSNHRLTRVWYSNTQNDFSPWAAILSLRTLASPSDRNVNYYEKQLTGKKVFELFLLSVLTYLLHGAGSFLRS